MAAGGEAAWPSSGKRASFCLYQHFRESLDHELQTTKVNHAHSERIVPHCGKANEREWGEMKYNLMGKSAGMMWGK